MQEKLQGQTAKSRPTAGSLPRSRAVCTFFISERPLCHLREVGAEHYGDFARRRLRAFPLVPDLHRAVRADGQDEIGNIVLPRDRVLLAVHDDRDELVACVEPEGIRKRAFFHRVQVHVLLHLAVPFVGVVDVPCVLRPHGDPQSDAVGAVRRLVTVVGVVEDILHRALGDLQRNRIIHAVRRRVSRVRDADQLAAAVEQPAARIAFVRRRIDSSLYRKVYTRRMKTCQPFYDKKIKSAFPAFRHGSIKKGRPIVFANNRAHPLSSQPLRLRPQVLR